MKSYYFFKNPLFALAFLFSFTANTQTVDDFDFEATTDNNMSVVFGAGTLDDFVGAQLMAFVNGAPVGYSAGIVVEDGSAGIGVQGTDNLCSCSLAYPGDELEFALLVNGEMIVNIDLNPSITYQVFGIYMVTEDFSFTVNACSDPSYLEYYFNPINIDFEDNTYAIINTCSTAITNNGITAEMFVEPLNTGANMTIPMPEGMLQQFEGGQIAAFMGDVCVGLETISDGFMAMGLWGDDYSTEGVIDGLLDGEVPTFAVLYNGGVFSLEQNELTGYTTNGVQAIENFALSIPFGCTDNLACNYIAYAVQDDGSCFYAAEFYTCAGNCISDTDNDGICDELEIPGCTTWGYNNYNELATDDDGSCTVSWEEDYANLIISANSELDSIETDLANYIYSSTAVYDSLQTAYYILDSLPINTDLITGWNIIGFTPTYEQDVVDALYSIEDILLILKNNNADVYLPEYGFNGIGNLIPGQGYQLKTSEAYSNFSFEQNPSFGCTYPNASNYNPSALIDDGSCTMPINTPLYQVGDIVEGGIVFYVDATGEHGLVAATEDLDQNYKWGCYGESVEIADDNYQIGTGLENTNAIVAQNCQTEYGGITAAQAALDAEINGYSDWYLPSRDELYHMYLNIGQGGLNANNNIGGFSNSWYWSSSETNSSSAWNVFFHYDGYSFSNYKNNTGLVRIIRAF